MIDRVKLLSDLSAGDIIPKLPGVKENRTGLTMGQHCELMAQEWKLSREEQDQLAVESHQKAAEAWERGFYGDLVSPFNGAEKDDNIIGDIYEFMRYLNDTKIFDVSLDDQISQLDETKVQDYLEQLGDYIYYVDYGTDFYGLPDVLN